MSNLIHNFKLAPIKIKSVRKPKADSPKKVYPKLVNGVCYNDNGTWRIEIPCISEDHHIIKRAFDFTPESHSLKNKIHVFRLKEDGKYECFIRSKEDTKYHPGLNEQYTPFRERGVYSGYLIKVNDKVMFDIQEYLIGGVNQNPLTEINLNLL